MVAPLTPLVPLQLPVCPLSPLPLAPSPALPPQSITARFAHAGGGAAIGDDSGSRAGELSLFISIGATQEVLSKHLLVANWDVQISRMCLDRALIQHRCHDEHARLLALFRRTPPAHPMQLHVEDFITLRQLPSIPLIGLISTQPEALSLRRDLVPEHQSIVYTDPSTIVYAIADEPHQPVPDVQRSSVEHQQHSRGHKSVKDRAFRRFSKTSWKAKQAIPSSAQRPSAPFVPSLGAGLPHTVGPPLSSTQQTAMLCRYPNPHPKHHLVPVELKRRFVGRGPPNPMFKA